jgi:hypothetical protein
MVEGNRRRGRGILDAPSSPAAAADRGRTTPSPDPAAPRHRVSTPVCVSTPPMQQWVAPHVESSSRPRPAHLPRDAAAQSSIAVAPSALPARGPHWCILDVRAGLGWTALPTWDSPSCGQAAALSRHPVTPSSAPGQDTAAAGAQPAMEPVPDRPAGSALVWSGLLYAGPSCRAAGHRLRGCLTCPTPDVSFFLVEPGSVPCLLIPRSPFLLRPPAGLRVWHCRDGQIFPGSCSLLPMLWTCD